MTALSRRDFFKRVGGAVAVAAAWPAVAPVPVALLRASVYHTIVPDDYRTPDEARAHGLVWKPLNETK